VTDTGRPAPALTGLFPRKGVVSWFHAGDACGGHGPEAGKDADRGCTVVICTYRRPASVLRMLGSLRGQTLRPRALVVVDASPGNETERAIAGYPALSSLAGCVLYCRVGGALAGLTRQRNFSLRCVATDLVAFFDDDVVLAPRCLSEMERALRQRSDAVGAGAAVEGEQVPRIWRARRLLGIVSTLAPGRYCRSGMSTPWGRLDPSEEPIEGDWLPGCGMMWRTAVAREVQFPEDFEGYAQGEDLEFSLRAREKGKLVLAPAARLNHLHAPAGRPDDFRLGYSAIANRFRIHRRCLPARGARDVLWFVYAWTLDTLILARHLASRRNVRPTLRQITGRFRAAANLLAESLSEVSRATELSRGPAAAAAPTGSAPAAPAGQGP